MTSEYKKQIELDAEKKYPKHIINSNQTPFKVDYNENERIAYIAGRTEEAEKNESLVEVLESISETKYPGRIFPEINEEDLVSIKNYCEQVLRFPIDRLSAQYGRIFQKIFSDQAKEALRRFK